MPKRELKKFKKAKLELSKVLFLQPEIELINYYVKSA